MYVKSMNKFGKKVIIIHPGEYYVSEKDEMIGTVLGSCVSLCLIDVEKGIAGMNHFMLPGRITKDDLFSDDSAKYGITAIQKLMDDMIKKGCEKKNLSAKIFGGGHVLNLPGRNAIPFDNVRLAKMMMEFEDIHIEKSDVGSNFTRKILLDVKSGKAYLRRSTREDVFEEVYRKETEYAKRSFAHGQD